MPRSPFSVLRSPFSALILLLLAACATPKTDKIGLTDWQFEYRNATYQASVPSFIHTDLMANGLIPDPYYATNEDSVRWVADSVWHYSCTLDPAALPKGDSLWVTFEGLAGRTVIEGLGDTVYYVDNMFCSYTFPLPATTTCIHLYFLPLRDSLAELNYGIPLPDRRAFTRIAPYQQGWDWGPTMPTCGIWKPVYVTNQHPSQPSQPTQPANPEVTLLQQPDSIGQSFTFCRDGKPLFIKGANWIPVHSFPVLDSANRARYRYLLCSAKEAHFNMLRVWGGGIYEHDYFFDLCDSLGIMVWMDFNFSTMLYPDTPDMLESIQREALQNIARIARHPCVVLWCGNNEVKNGWEDWGWQDQYHWTPAQRQRLQHAIDTIFGPDGIIARAVATCDPLRRPYITTSPLYGWGHPECVTHGDSHYWGVWWGEEPFEAYGPKTGRFMSEYGFQSYPAFATVERYCPPDQRHLDSPAMRSHQKHLRGRQIIDNAMKEYYGVDAAKLNVEDYCYLSQVLQAWGVGYGIYQHLTRQPHCMGTLYWQLNDCWPVASWSSIDYYGNWKALHYRVKALYDPQADLGGYWRRYYSHRPDLQHLQPSRFDLSVRHPGRNLAVTITARTPLRDVQVETVPHIDGHFTDNFFDLPADSTATLRFHPVDPKADLSQVSVKVQTLDNLLLKLQSQR